MTLAILTEKNCQSSKVFLTELVSGPLASQFMKMVSHLAGHLMIELGVAADKPGQFTKEPTNQSLTEQDSLLPDDANRKEKAKLITHKRKRAKQRQDTR